MTELERRKQRKELLMNKRKRRIEIAKSIIIYSQKFIDSETELLESIENGTEVNRDLLRASKNSSKHTLLYLFSKFKDIK